MTAVFMFIWCVYSLQALYHNLYGRRAASMSAQALQMLLVLLSLWWAFRGGVFSRTLWSPIDIALGLATGHLLFALSLSITHRRLGDVLRHLVDFRGLAAFVKQTPELVARFAGVSLVEELVYRVAAQDMLVELLGPLAAILITAACFSALHGHFFRNGFWCAFEFFMFTVIIGMLYYGLSSLTLATLAHWVRNTESAYLEYGLLIEEHNDSEAALRTLSNRYGAAAEPL